MDKYKLTLKFLRGDADAFTAEKLVMDVGIKDIPSADAILNYLGLHESDVQIAHRTENIVVNAMNEVDITPVIVADALPPIHMNWDSFQRMYADTPMFRTALIVELCRLRTEVRARQIAWREAESRAQGCETLSVEEYTQPSKQTPYLPGYPLDIESAKCRDKQDKEVRDFLFGGTLILGILTFLGWCSASQSPLDTENWSLCFALITSVLFVFFALPTVFSFFDSTPELNMDEYYASRDAWLAQNRIAIQSA